MRKRKSRIWHGIVCGLLCLQLNLLGLSAVHHHDDGALIGGQKPATVRSAGAKAPAPAGDWTLCPVCQVMRIGAARPAVASRPLAVPVIYVVLQVWPACGVPSGRSAILHSRAPPLS